MIYLFALWSFLFHPIHISVTEIEFNEKANALQIISRIFIDDLETSIRARIKQPELDLMNPAGSLTTDKLVADYLNEHLVIKLNDEVQRIQFLGHEVDGFAMVCYIEIENIKPFTTIEVINTTITELYDDQSNLVHVTYKGPVKSMRLMRSKPSDQFTFDNK
jgi:hypothetical protein